MFQLNHTGTISIGDTVSIAETAESVPKLHFAWLPEPNRHDIHRGYGMYWERAQSPKITLCLGIGVKEAP